MLRLWIWSKGLEEAKMTPRTAVVRLHLQPDGRIGMEVQSALSNAELLFALQDLCHKLVHGTIGQKSGTLVPGMLTPDLRRVPVDRS